MQFSEVLEFNPANPLQGNTKTFADDLAESDANALDEWQHRSLLSRLKERLARIGAYWL